LPIQPDGVIENFMIFQIITIGFKEHEQLKVNTEKKNDVADLINTANV